MAEIINLDEFDPQLAANYRNLHSVTGEPWELIAGRLESSPQLAAWARAQAKGDTPEAREQAPEQRSADPTLITAEATTPAPEPVVEPVAPAPAPKRAPSKKA